MTPTAPWLVIATTEVSHARVEGGVGLGAAAGAFALLLGWWLWRRRTSDA